jgi:hypothetical protein
VSPFAGWLWRSEGDFRLEVHNMFSIVPGQVSGSTIERQSLLGMPRRQPPSASVRPWRSTQCRCVMP